MVYQNGRNPPPPSSVIDENTFQLTIADGKMVLVRGSTDVSVFMAVKRGANTLSAVQYETGLKKSTAFSSLKRLSESGVVKS